MIPLSRPNDREAALRYVERYFLPSSALMGIVGLLGGFFLSTYQWSRHLLTVPVFSREMTVALLSALLSLLHARYQLFILERFPGHYRELGERAKSFRLDRLTPVVHPGRKKVLGGYLLGAAALGGTVFVLRDQLPMAGAACFFLCGFFITRVTFWKKVLETGGPGGGSDGKGR